MQQDVDAEYNVLMDELRTAVDEDGMHSERATALRLEIEALMRVQMGLAIEPVDRGPNALN